MNVKLIAFSGIITALLGAGIGFVVANLLPCPNTSSMYRNFDEKYAIAGAVVGLLIGSSQEMIREFKQEQDEEEALLRDLNKAIRSTNEKYKG